MNPVYRNFFSMGTRFDMVLPGLDESKGTILYNIISTEVNRLNGLLSNYDESSALSALNLNAILNSYSVEEELFDLISRVKNMSEKSYGFFDPVKTTNTDSSIKPLLEEHSNCSSLSGFEFITLSRKNLVVRFERAGLSIDSGGFGKGYALDCVKTLLTKHGISQAFISFGESSVLAMGNHPYGDDWKIGIPGLYSEKILATLNLKDCSLSVSGNTPANRIRYPMGHIINPHTGQLINKTGIVCVTGPCALEAEVLSTALFASGEENEMRILKNFPAYKAIRILYDDASESSFVKEISI